jgi:hypothetical protein
MDMWDRTPGGVLADEAEAPSMISRQPRKTPSTPCFATKPTTKASAIACVEYVADIDLVTEELGHGY